MRARQTPQPNKSRPPRAPAALCTLARLSRAPVALCTLTSLALAPHLADAQTAADRRQAEALFAEGKKLQAAGQIAEACRKFEGSYKIDPAGGTVLNLGLCHEKEGKIASAWAELKEALALAKKANRKDREKIARERIEELEPRLPYFLIVVEKPDIAGLAVTVDDDPIANEGWGAQIPVDPGKHTVRATAPNHTPFESSFEATEGKKVTVRVPGLSAAAVPAATESPAPAEPTLRFPWMRPSGIAVGSVGLAAVVVGAIFGGRALSLADQAKQNCPNLACNESGLAAVQEGRTSATASDILLGAGSGFAAVGVVLFFVGGTTTVAPPPAKGSLVVAPTARVSPYGTFLGLEGTW
ncbi:MAG: hypothetical protein IPK82_34615 [Polyangiaceae bacterium]|nr:hypothetical protein [Polyangiaceae bacterium]